jgi:hypothetical protein
MDADGVWSRTDFLLGNLDKIQTHVPFESIQKAGLLFLWAAFIGIIQRYLAMLIDTGTTTFQKAAKLPAQDLNPARFFSIYISSLPPSVRFAGAWAAKNMQKGDLTATGKWLFSACYVQCFLGGILALLLLWALAVILLNVR